MGLVLGWMSTRVLGQYDLLFAGDTSGDAVSYVGPNIVALERRHGFPPRQFRLWIALHEVTHRCQFTGVPWLREYFLSQVDQVLAHVTPIRTVWPRPWAGPPRPCATGRTRWRTPGCSAWWPRPNSSR